ncbi:phosphoglucosamine mutase [Burkholderiales bacterium]|nr:MAG: phosphoglucosamine mutase [Burkholderiales bacterium]CAG0965826.1 phosphoglucosamine mutase [Burkholderiales bacterium]
MSRKYFGTDGVRGKVGDLPITPELVMHLGYAAGKVLLGQEQAQHPGGDKPAVLIGKDTRISGYLLEAALEAGFSAAGVDVLLTGPLTTPGVAYLTRALRLAAGVVISASHNPFEDNGIKFFSAAGTKLPDAVEQAIERELEAPIRCVPSTELGKARRVNDAAGRYIEFCKSSFPNELDLKGLKLVVDCAHGAAYNTAPEVFHELGAEVLAIGNHPDGVNINAGVGATAPGLLQETVRATGADLGIALDGDGDRLIMVDAQGKSYDGDQLLYLIARHRHAGGHLRGGVVGTLMSNLGFEHALARLAIPFARAAVGDRYVLELMLAKGWQLGGENSGHIICLDKHTTGDGIVAALQVLHVLRASASTLAQLTADLAMYTQKMINVRFAPGKTWKQWADNPRIRAAQQAAEEELADRGRILLRASGTEPVLRVMVEARVAADAERLAEQLAATVREAL